MTAHPESVVGRLRAARVDVLFRTSDANATRLQDEYIDAAPALLAALEKVWAETEPEFINPGTPVGIQAITCSANHAKLVVRTILAPLFESPEKTT